jgi:hypothetical protein
MVVRFAANDGCGINAISTNTLCPSQSTGNAGIADVNSEVSLMCCGDDLISDSALPPIRTADETDTNIQFIVHGDLGMNIYAWL